MWRWILSVHLFQEFSVRCKLHPTATLCEAEVDMEHLWDTSSKR